MSEFLSKFGRALRPIGGDGNCLFRSLSYCLFETEDYHSPLRCLLARFESRNERVFTSHLPQQSHSQQSSILEHVKRISNPGTWGTDLELLAAATYFQIPVYFCCTDNVTDKWLWNHVQPIASPTELSSGDKRLKRGGERGKKRKREKREEKKKEKREKRKKEEKKKEEGFNFHHFLYVHPDVKVNY